MFTDPFGLCTLNSKNIKCLEEVFGKSVRDVKIQEARSDKSKWAARTGRNFIKLFVSCQSFNNDPETLLEEFYHVLEQWNTGRMNLLKYGLAGLGGYENNKYEIEAKKFAGDNLDKFKKCLACAE